MIDNTEKLKLIFCEALGLEKDQVVSTLTYGSIKNWDSIAHLVLVNKLETQFDIMLDTMDTLDMSSFQKAKEILVKYNISFDLDKE